MGRLGGVYPGIDGEEDFCATGLAEPLARFDVFSKLRPKLVGEQATARGGLELGVNGFWKLLRLY